MKLTKSQLRKIIMEEIDEAHGRMDVGSSGLGMPPAPAPEAEADPVSDLVSKISAARQSALENGFPDVAQELSALAGSIARGPEGNSSLYLEVVEDQG